MNDCLWSVFIYLPLAVEALAVLCSNAFLPHIVSQGQVDWVRGRLGALGHS